MEVIQQAFENCKGTITDGIYIYNDNIKCIYIAHFKGRIYKVLHNKTKSKCKNDYILYDEKQQIDHTAFAEVKA